MIFYNHLSKLELTAENNFEFIFRDMCTLYKHDMQEMISELKLHKIIYCHSMNKKNVFSMWAHLFGSAGLLYILKVGIVSLYVCVCVFCHLRHLQYIFYLRGTCVWKTIHSFSQGNIWTLCYKCCFLKKISKEKDDTV